MDFLPTYFMGDWTLLYKVIFVVIIIMSCLSLFMWISIHFSRFKKNAADKRKAKLTELLAIEIIPYFYEPVESLKEQSITFAQKHIKSNENKQLITDILLEQTKNFMGDAFDKTQSIFKWMGLHKHSLRKLESSNWTDVCMGLVEIGALRYSEANDRIKKLLKHKNRTVKKVALQTLIDINQGNEFPKELVLNLKREISIWEQAIMYNNMQRLEMNHQWELWELLDSPDSVFAFGLKAACLGNSTYINQPLVIERALALNDEAALIAFIEWLGRFDVSEPLYEMLNKRMHYTNNVQLHILKQSYILQGVENELMHIINTENQTLAVAAAHALIKVGKDTELKDWIIDKEHKADIFEKAKHHLIYE